MAVDADVEARLRAKFDAVLPHLDERAARLVLAGEAPSLGHGGLRQWHVRRAVHDRVSGRVWRSWSPVSPHRAESAGPGVGASRRG